MQAIRILTRSLFFRWRISGRDRLTVHTSMLRSEVAEGAIYVGVPPLEPLGTVETTH